MNWSSLHTRSFIRILFSAFRYRWSKNSEKFPGLSRNGPLVPQFSGTEKGKKLFVFQGWMCSFSIDSFNFFKYLWNFLQSSSPNHPSVLWACATSFPGSFQDPANEVGACELAKSKDQLPLQLKCGVAQRNWRNRKETEHFDGWDYKRRYYFKM